MKRKDLLFYILLLLISIPVSAGWQRPVTNYTRHTYKAGNQNWSIQQHDNGWIYVANNKGLLEFDGVAVRAGHHCAQPLLEYLGVRSATRASLMFYNTEEEVDALVKSVAGVRRRMGYGE